MRKLLLLFILPLSFSCNNDDLYPKSAIDSNIRIELRELLSPDKRQLYLYGATEKAYPCINFPLLHEQHLQDNQLEITFTGVAELDPCLTALGPATTAIDLSHLGNGEYQLELNNGLERNTGRLVMSETETILEFIDQNGIEIIREVTKRVPKNTYWGTVGYHTEETQEKLHQFLARLKEIEGVVFKPQVSGDYYFYKIDQNGEIITFTENAGYHFVQAVIFQVEPEGEEKTMEKIMAIAASYFDEMYINIESDRGLRFNNWEERR